MVIEFFLIEFSGSIQRGLGQWCLNTDLLKDLNHVNYIKNNWEEFWEYRKEFENAEGWADAAKHMVRSLTVFYLIQKKQVERELKMFLQKKKKILRIF